MGTKSGSLDQLVELVGSELTLPKGEESKRFRDVLCRAAVEVNLSQVDDSARLTDTVGKEITEANEEHLRNIAEANKQDVAENNPECPQRKTIVFIFDEFDSSRDGEPLGWLRWFLSPMQDGQVLYEGKPLLIGKCVFRTAARQKRSGVFPAQAPRLVCQPLPHAAPDDRGDRRADRCGRRRR
jgi:hypothetical protein